MWSASESDWVQMTRPPQLVASSNKRAGVSAPQDYLNSRTIMTMIKIVPRPPP